MENRPLVIFPCLFNQTLAWSRNMVYYRWISIIPGFRDYVNAANKNAKKKEQINSKKIFRFFNLLCQLLKKIILFS
jgi:hypothetical protein